MPPTALRPRRLALACALALAFAACSGDRTDPTAPDAVSAARGGAPGPDLRAAIAAQERATGRLLQNDGVAGTAVGLTADGRPAVKIFATHGAVGGLPRALDGIPVVVEVTGPFRAELPRAEGKGGAPAKKPGGGGGSANPTSRFARPVPIGVSTGNVGECSAGTIGARVKRGSSYYALSNNHVFALENTAQLGSQILQPGRYDTNCAWSTADVIGTLAKFVPISFGSDNEVDAALASVTTATVGNATFSGGYGVPGSTPVAASVGLAVQKCGRTTKCTTGTVSAVNATINVQYSAGVARFVHQVVVSGNKGSFSRAGDSGSLIVTNTAAAAPVALLFAGSNTSTIGNPIGTVLSKLGVGIDGK
ncbi:MAG TPA: hypothetical protein VFS40_05270 [Gemmatimonadales bacterium]|nr:hypothetical protein [Gemmatimonadales bacterium]